MGCFSETCLLTRLPILYYDRCAAMFITPQPETRRSPCYPYGLFTPLAPHFSGRYDDYGNLTDIIPDDIVKNILSSIKFRSNPGNNGPVENIILSEDFGKDMRNLLYSAGRFELEALLQADTSKTPVWTPVYAVFMLSDFLNKILESCLPFVDSEYITSTTFRLSFTGPLRDALRSLDPIWATGNTCSGPGIDRQHAFELYAIIDGMGRLRVNFAPVCNAGSQYALNDDWTHDFYLSQWVRSETMFLDNEGASLAKRRELEENLTAYMSGIRPEKDFE